MDQYIIARHDATALRRFRAAMRRHERRARRMGLRGAEYHIRAVRLDPRAWETRPGYESAEEFLRGFAEIMREVATEREFHSPRTRRYNRQGAFMHEVAADAVARLRADLTRDV